MVQCADCSREVFACRSISAEHTLKGWPMLLMFGRLAGACCFRLFTKLEQVPRSQRRVSLVLGGCHRRRSSTILMNLRPSSAAR